ASRAGDHRQNVLSLLLHCDLPHDLSMPGPARTRIHTIIRCIALLTLAGAHAMAADEEPMGRVAMLQGQAHALAPSGARRPLARNAQVFAGEVLVTQPGTRIQVRMADTAMVGLHPGTEFHLLTMPRGSARDVPIRYRLERGGFVTV